MDHAYLVIALLSMYSNPMGLWWAIFSLDSVRVRLSNDLQELFTKFADITQHPTVYTLKIWRICHRFFANFDPFLLTLNGFNIGE